MSLLTSEPAAPVRSLDELLAIAYALEHEAAEHYTRFAVQARQEGLPHLGQLFERLAAEERHHEQYVQAWSQQRSGKMPDTAALRWAPPETFDVAAGVELASSRLGTTYRILAVAVKNEDRAFALWSYIAAHAETNDLRTAAEAMARTELQHAWQLRRARRAAYHAEDRRQHAGAPTLEKLAVDEARLADFLDHAASANVGAGSELRRLAQEARRIAAQLSKLDGSAARIARGPTDILTLAEGLVEDYLEISDRSGDEIIVAQAQTLAEQAVLRLAQLRAMGGALPGRNPAA